MNRKRKTGHERNMSQKEKRFLNYWESWLLSHFGVQSHQMEMW